MKKFNLDFTITKTEFLQLIDLWDTKGCYAIFHNAELIKFKASELPESQRYLALENFGWTFEIAIPSSASDGWGQITSPSIQIIKKIETQLQDLY